MVCLPILRPELKGFNNRRRCRSGRRPTPGTLRLGAMNALFLTMMIKWGGGWGKKVTWRVVMSGSMANGTAASHHPFVTATVDFTAAGMTSHRLLETFGTRCIG